MNDGKKRRSSAELPAHKRFAKSPSAIQGFCVDPLYLFRERVEKNGFFSPRTKHFSENLAKMPCLDCSMGRGGNTGVRSSQQAQQASTRLRILRCSGPLLEQSKLLAGARVSGGDLKA